MSLAPLTKGLSFLNKALKQKSKGTGATVKLVYVGRGATLPATILKSAPPMVRKRLKAGSSIENWVTKTAQVYVLQAQFVESKNHYGYFTPSPYGMARDLVGTTLRKLLGASIKSLQIEIYGKSEDELKGLCVGVEMAAYQFKKHWPKSETLGTQIKIKSDLKNSAKMISEACAIGEGVNLARFFVDLPPNVLGPKAYAETLKGHFTGKAKTKVTVWNADRLKKEKMGLHIAVGQGSTDRSYMVHVQYRGAGKEKPFAFVGKGITFDTGGLDIKPASAMRLMKKDMGGSASVAGLAHWVVASKQEINCDFYFAIAENAVSDLSFRPGDVLTSRSGQTVEIHNTDAEGRLVLADVMTVASEQKPQFLVDVATLTGAIKYGLGASTPGMFSNDDNLAESLLRCGQAAGDMFWRMPLVPEERSRLKSDVADMVNCTDGFGGAITAALFLEKFTGDVPWAHFDIYSWTTGPKGAIGASGGTGQVVQALAEFLAHQS